MKDWWQTCEGPPPKDLNKGLVRIKGCLFVDLPKSYQKPSAEKWSWYGHQKNFVQTQGQA